MSLDQAAYGELWRITDASNGDLRPEYLIPVMFSESGLDPSLQNHAGADYWGINQISGDTLRSAGVNPQDYLTWPASRQLRRFAGPFFLAQNRQYGPIRSATRLYQANMCPATLPDAHSFGDVVARKNGTKYHGQEANCYAGNAGLFDSTHKGYITVGDLAIAIGNTLKHASVDAAIAAAYVFRGEPRPGVGRFHGGCFGPGSETTGIWIPEAKCPVCHNYAWHGPEQRPINGHHPSCVHAGLSGPGLGQPKNPVFGSDFDTHGNYVGGGRGGGGGGGGSGLTSGGFPWALAALGVGLIGAAGAAWWYLDQPRSRLLENPAGKVQSLLFRRDDGWTVRRAKNWARDHGFKTSKVDLTADHVRLRQRPPGGRMRTVPFGKGISAVMSWR